APTRNHPRTGHPADPAAQADDRCHHHLDRPILLARFLRAVVRHDRFELRRGDIVLGVAAQDASPGVDGPGALAGWQAVALEALLEFAGELLPRGLGRAVARQV